VSPAVTLPEYLKTNIIIPKNEIATTERAMMWGGRISRSFSNPSFFSLFYSLFIKNSTSL